MYIYLLPRELILESRIAAKKNTNIVFDCRINSWYN